MSTGQKVAVGAAVVGVGAVAAVGVAGAAAIGAGALGAGAYAVHQSQEAKKQNASPLRLHLRCISGSDLIAADWGGKSDPYVETKVGYVALRSTVKKKTLNPVWNEDLEMGIYDKHLQKDLKLEVFDKDTLSDDSLGTAKVNFAEIPYNMPKEYTLQLKNKKNKGTLRVALWLTQTAVANQGGPQQGFNQGVNAAPQQGFQQPYMSQQQYPQQGYPPQGQQQAYMSQPQYPQQGYPPQGQQQYMSQQQFPQQGYPPQGQQQPYMGQPMQQPYMGQPMQQPYMGQPMQQPYMSQPMQQPYMGQQYVSQQQFQPQNPYNSQFPQQGYPPQ